MEIKKAIEMRAGDVRVINHTEHELEPFERDIVDYWKNTMSVYGYTKNADFDIHIWDFEDWCHIEVGLRVYNKRGFGGIVARAIMVFDLVKTTKRGMMLIDCASSPWFSDIKGFQEDTENLLIQKYGWKGFIVKDLDEFEMKFFRCEPMMLSEDGRRIGREGNVLLEDGYKTLGLTNKVLFDMLL